MKKHALLILSIIALLVVSGLAQDEPQDEPQELTDLLLGQDVFREVFEDDNWVLAATGALPQNPPNVISTATATYESPSRRVGWFILEFEDQVPALDFVANSSAGLRPNLTKDVEDVTEDLNLDLEGAERENLADIAVIAEFAEGAKKRLTMVRGSLVVFFESDLPQETLILLAQLQVDFMAELGR